MDTTQFSAFSDRHNTGNHNISNHNTGEDAFDNQAPQQKAQARPGTPNVKPPFHSAINPDLLPSLRRVAHTQAFQMRSPKVRNVPCLSAVNMSEKPPVSQVQATLRHFADKLDKLTQNATSEHEHEHEHGSMHLSQNRANQEQRPTARSITPATESIRRLIELTHLESSAFNKSFSFAKRDQALKQEQQALANATGRMSPRSFEVYNQHLATVNSTPILTTHDDSSHSSSAATHTTTQRAAVGAQHNTENVIENTTEKNTKNTTEHSTPAAPPSPHISAKYVSDAARLALVANYRHLSKKGRTLSENASGTLTQLPNFHPKALSDSTTQHEQATMKQQFANRLSAAQYVDSYLKTRYNPANPKAFVSDFYDTLATRAYENPHQLSDSNKIYIVYPGKNYEQQKNSYNALTNEGAVLLAKQLQAHHEQSWQGVEGEYQDVAHRLPKETQFEPWQIVMSTNTNRTDASPLERLRVRLFSNDLKYQINQHLTDISSGKMKPTVVDNGLR